MVRNVMVRNCGSGKVVRAFGCVSRQGRPPPPGSLMEVGVLHPLAMPLAMMLASSWRKQAPWAADVGARDRTQANGVTSFCAVRVQHCAPPLRVPFIPSCIREPIGPNLEQGIFLRRDTPSRPPAQCTTGCLATPPPRGQKRRVSETPK
eukprot:gene1046-biopygen7695